MKVLSGYLDVSTNKVGGLVLTSWGTGLYPTRWSQHPSTPALSASYAFSHDWGAEIGGQASPAHCLSGGCAGGGYITFRAANEAPAKFSQTQSLPLIGPFPG